jgi:glycogen debranching enzyme
MSSPTAARQPWLHELVVSVRGNVTCVSDSAGDLDPGTAQGVFVDDRRVLNALQLEVDGERPVRVSHVALGERAEFLASARNLGDGGPDPVVEISRRRELVTGGLLERIRVQSRAEMPISAELRIALGSDGAAIGTVKSGFVDFPAIPPRLVDDQVRFETPGQLTTVGLAPPPRTLERRGMQAFATFALDLSPGAARELVLRVKVQRTQPTPLDADPGGDLVDWSSVQVSSADPRLEAAVAASLTDLRALVLTDPMAPTDVFAAAGTPWYLTLFGRDSIWAARLALPIGTELARGTLRALGRRQGQAHDSASGEAPGKIPHEVRRFPYVDPASGMSLPAVYYGSVDATPLWVVLLHDAWCWGMPDAEVQELLPVLDAAVAWILGDGTPDEDGLLRYLDESGRGLSNQGWKDSGDGIRFRDGTLAKPPIALVEAQAYAVHALECAARIDDAFERGDAAHLRQEADHLRRRLRSRFWTPDPLGLVGPYLGLAIDGTGRLVDALASNMGHVLGTESLTEEEAGRVAAVVTRPELLDRFGVRTLGSRNGGYNPIGYHTGSIWTHDTAVTALGLASEGFSTEAVRVARTLLRSAETFDYRWPELYAGEAMMGRPAPYPAACRPQAWSAASAVALLSIGLGLRPERSTRTLHVRAPRPAAYGAMRVAGLRFCGGQVDLDVAADGSVTVESAPDDVKVSVEAP